MKQAPITSHNYTRLKKAIAGELLSGAERVRRSYREEVVRTAWNIGKLLRGSLGLGDRPSAGNAELIARLSKDLGRHDSFFYDAAKFHRLYPDHPPLALSWSHYSLLIRLEDPRERRALEKKAIADGINAKDLRMYTRLDPSQVPAAGKSVVLPVERGRLYHYRAANTPADGRVLIDIGFGIERDVRCNKKGSFHSGLIVRAVREVHGFKSSQDGPIPSKSGMNSIGTEDYSAKISPFDKSRLYTYAATLIRVIDGDTILARVDLGFRAWITQTFRLRGIDTPEVTCALGRKAKAEVAARLTSCTRLVIKSYKQEKYGRFLADVFYKKENPRLPAGGDDGEQILQEGVFLNQELLDEGLAVPYLLP